MHATAASGHEMTCSEALLAKMKPVNGDENASQPPFSVVEGRLVTPTISGTAVGASDIC